MIAPNCDHLLHAFASEFESLRNVQRGAYSDSLAKILLQESTGEVTSKQ